MTGLSEVKQEKKNQISLRPVDTLSAEEALNSRVARMKATGW